MDSSTVNKMRIPQIRIYSKRWLLWCLLGLTILQRTSSETITVMKRKSTARPYQIRYNSSDPELQKFLPYVQMEPFMSIEGTFFIRLSGTIYTMSAIPMNWFKAYQMCRMKGGYLFDSGKRFTEVTTHLLKTQSPVSVKIWSAATCLSISGTFRWFSTGQDLTHDEFKWAPGQPASKANSCVYIEKVDGVFLMKTAPCNLKMYALCYINELHKHGHKGMSVRNKKKSVRMHSIFV